MHVQMAGARLFFAAIPTARAVWNLALLFAFGGGAGRNFHLFRELAKVRLVRAGEEDPIPQVADSAAPFPAKRVRFERLPSRGHCTRCNASERRFGLLPARLAGA